MRGVGHSFSPGAVFGDWTVLSAVPSAERTIRKGRQVLCRCKCGNEAKIATSQLITGASRSCWPCGQQRAGIKRSTHGQTKSPEFRAWQGLRQRCFNTRARGYKDYGGRGINVDPLWADPRDGFERFFLDMGRRPSNKHSIHRVDNDGPYSPGNCVWATTREQARAKRSNRQITFRGKTQIATDWCAETGISYHTFSYRLDHGWPEDLAATTPALGESVRLALTKLDPESDAFRLLSAHAQYGNFHAIR